jgi:hypothetical protein
MSQRLQHAEMSMETQVNSISIESTTAIGTTAATTIAFALLLDIVMRLHYY